MQTLIFGVSTRRLYAIVFSICEIDEGFFICLANINDHLSDELILKTRASHSFLNGVTIIAPYPDKIDGLRSISLFLKSRTPQ